MSVVSILTKRLCNATADRLFDILQLLRVATHPTTAATISERLEVTVRTVYRDIATLQARRTAAR